MRPLPRCYTGSVALLLALALLLSACGRSDTAGPRSPSEDLEGLTDDAVEERPQDPTGEGARPQSASDLGKLAFVREGDIWVRSLPDGESRRLTRDGKNHTPRWSPSGGWLAFRKGGELWVMREDGAEARRITGQLAGRAGTSPRPWSPVADTLAYAEGGSVWLLTPEDGRKRRLGGKGAGRRLSGDDVGSPVWSADGRWLAYTEHHAAGNLPGYDVLRVVAADGGEERELLSTRTAVAAKGWGIIPAGWSGDGRYVLYWPAPQFSASLLADGVRLELVPAKGGEPGPFTDFMLAYPDFLAWSPDGDALALIEGGGRESWTGKSLVLRDKGGVAGVMRRLSDEGEAAASPAWSPDGGWIAYAAAPDPGPDGMTDMTKASLGRRVWVIARDGSGRRRLVPDGAYGDRAQGGQHGEERPLWSADGTHILLVRVEEGMRASLWLAPVEGGGPLPVADHLSPAPGEESYYLDSERAGERSFVFPYYGHMDWDALFDWWRGRAPTPTGLGWKTYSNPVYGVTLRYPPSWGKVPGYGESERLGGADGFFQLIAMNSPGRDLDEAATLVFIGQPEGER